MTDDNPNETNEVVRSEPGPVPPQAVDLPFIITASELRDRKTKRRQKHDLPGRPAGL
jgi:hypothetical protein